MFTPSLSSHNWLLSCQMSAGRVNAERGIALQSSQEECHHLGLPWLQNCWWKWFNYHEMMPYPGNESIRCH